MSLHIFGHWLSEPSRSVAWLCSVAGVDFTFEEINLSQNEHKTEEFARYSPNGLVPAIYDARHGVRMSEGLAILQYICERDDLILWYPRQPKIRSVLLQLLHWHHSNTRKLSYPLFATFMREKDPNSPLVQKDVKLVEPSLRQLENWVPVDRFLCATEHPTIADLAFYPEFDQTIKFKLIDFSPFPRIVQWMKKMEQIPFHDEMQAGLNRYYAQWLSETESQQ